MRLDKILAYPIIYAVLVFILVRARNIALYQEKLDSLFGGNGNFPVLRGLIYVLCACVYGIWIFRWWTGRLSGTRPMLLTICGLFAALWLSTALHLGITDYHINWHSGFALMLMLDMGFQREKASVLEGFSWALLVWLLLNLLSMALYPYGYYGPNNGQSYVPEWLLGTRTRYFRFTLAALGFEAVRAHSSHGRWTLRTVLTALIVLLTTALERGVTALIGTAFLLILLTMLRGKALPKWLNPAVIAFISVMLTAILILLPQGRLNTLAGVVNRGASLPERINGWRAALSLISKNWLLGIGLCPRSFTESLIGCTDAHNQTLEILLHGGVASLLFYFAIIGLATWKTLRYRRSGAVKTAALLLMTFLLTGTTEVFHTDPIYYPLFVLVFQADRLSEKSIVLPDLTLRRR